MLAIKNAKLETISNGTIKNGSIVVKDGKILSLGENIDLSNCKRIIDGQGRIVTPGIIDSHTHLGLSESGVGQEGRDTNEGTSPLTPLCSVRDGINMKDQAFESFRKAGTTSVGVLPGSGNIIGGTGLALKCKGHIVDEAILKDPIGMKAALGENPKGFYGSKKKSPATRMGNAAVLRGALLKAQEYLDKLNSPTEEDFENNADKISMGLLPVMKGEIPLIIHCHRHDDIVTVVRICEELDIDYTIEHCTDGHLIADYLGKKKVVAMVGPGLSSASKIENANTSDANPAILHENGVKVCLMTDHPFLNCRYFLQYGAISHKHGLAFDETLKAMTINPAEALGIEDRVGSLEVGKDADFVVLNGEPLSYKGSIQETYIEGKLVWEREKY